MTFNFIYYDKNGTETKSLFCGGYIKVQCSSDANNCAVDKSILLRDDDTEESILHSACNLETGVLWILNVSKTTVERTFRCWLNGAKLPGHVKIPSSVCSPAPGCNQSERKIVEIIAAVFTVFAIVLLCATIIWILVKKGKLRLERLRLLLHFYQRQRLQESRTSRRPQLFGGNLDEYVRATGEAIPLILEQCITAMRAMGLQQEGIFRQCVSSRTINLLKDSFEKGENPLARSDSSINIHAVAGVLKLYFRELREPLFPLDMYDQLLACLRRENKSEIVLRLKEVISQIPVNVATVIEYFFVFLHELHIAFAKKKNGCPSVITSIAVITLIPGSQMNAYNLGVCVGPALLRRKQSEERNELEIMQDLQDSTDVVRIIAFLIEFWGDVSVISETNRPDSVV